MKQFANEKEGPAKKPSAGLDGGGKNSRQDKKSQEFGGFGTSGGNGYADPMEAARFGHPGAVAMLQSGGGLGQRGPRPIPGHLVVKAQRLLGADLSGVTLVEDPSLAEQGKRGVAEDGQRIRLVPGGLRDMKLIWHEMVHIVQQQKALTGTGGGGAAAESETSVTAPGSEPGAVDPEQEAKAGSTALAGGGAVEVAGQGAGAMYSDEPEPEGAHGEFQGNESGAVCTSGETSESGEAQPAAEAAKAAEVVEIPKGLQEFFDAPSYEFGENGKVIGASPETQGISPDVLVPCSEITASELNQAIATLEGMSGDEREVFRTTTGHEAQNPATVVFQAKIFLQSIETQQAIDSEPEGLTYDDLFEHLSAEKVILESILADSEIALSDDDKNRFENRIQKLDDALNWLESEDALRFLASEVGPVEQRDLSGVPVIQANVTSAPAAVVAVSLELLLTESAFAALLESQVALTIAAIASGQAVGSPRVPQSGPTGQLESASKILTAAAMTRMLAVAQESAGIAGLGATIFTMAAAFSEDWYPPNPMDPPGSSDPPSPSEPPSPNLGPTIAIAGLLLNAFSNEQVEEWEHPDIQAGREPGEAEIGWAGPMDSDGTGLPAHMQPPGLRNKDVSSSEPVAPSGVVASGEKTSGAVSSSGEKGKKEEKGKQKEKGDLLPSQQRHIDRIENAIKEHAKESDFEAVEKERRGEIVGINPDTGAPWDHITEMRETRKALNKSRKALSGSLGSPDHNQDTRELVQEAIDRATRVIDRMDSAMNNPLPKQR